MRCAGWVGFFWVKPKMISRWHQWVMWMVSSIDDTCGDFKAWGLVVIDDFLLRLGCSDTCSWIIHTLWMQILVHSFKKTYKPLKMAHSKRKSHFPTINFQRAMWVLGRVLSLFICQGIFYLKVQGIFDLCLFLCSCCWIHSQVPSKTWIGGWNPQDL